MIEWSKSEDHKKLVSVLNANAEYKVKYDRFPSQYDEYIARIRDSMAGEAVECCTFWRDHMEKQKAAIAAGKVPNRLSVQTDEGEDVSRPAKEHPSMRPQHGASASSSSNPAGGNTEVPPNPHDALGRHLRAEKWRRTLSST